MKKVMAGGVFSALHPGHEFFLKKARSLGDYLVVVLASDKTVHENKGPLVKKIGERKRNLEKLGIADKVIAGKHRGHYNVITDEKPDIIALGYDQDLDKDFEKWINECGFECKVVRIKEKFRGYSSSKILKQKKKGLVSPLS